MSFFRKSVVSGPPEYLVVGLGNPGKKYEFTRHNTGFLTIDYIAGEVNCKIEKIQYKAVTGQAEINGHKCMLMKPQTFMNNSGEAVSQAAKFYKIPPEKIIIIYDDITLDVGKMRIRRKGSDGGHNGMKSIIYLLNSDQFPRIRLGIGKKPHPEYDLADWVLSSFTKQELEDLKKVASDAFETVKMILDDNIDGAMSKYNS